MNPTKCVWTIAIVITMLFAADQATAQDGAGSGQLEFNLFQNFYTQPGASMNQAALYNAPHPVPYWVGSSYYTYQPYYPHQHLYPHAKNYYSYYGTSAQFYSVNCQFGRGGDALNKTTVVWQSGCNHMGNLPFSGFAAQKLQDSLQSRKYCLNCDWRPGVAHRGRAGGCASGGCN